MFLQLSFFIEMECSSVKSAGKFWVIFVYASTNTQLRQQQWDFLIQERPKWGEEWFVGEDGNDIRDHEEKRGGRRRSDLSFRNFNKFICDMEIEKIKAVGRMYTWANNREGERFVEEKVDRFFWVRKLVT